MRPPTDEHRDLASCRHSHLAAVYLAYEADDDALGEGLVHGHAEAAA